MIDHISLRVRDFPAQVKFYTAALKPLGYRVWMEFPDNTGMAGEDGKPDFWIAKSSTESTTPTHIAFLSDRKGVSAFYRAAIKAGATDNGPPGLRADYHPNYYGAFIKDPEGNNIEAVCHAPDAAEPNPARDGDGEDEAPEPKAKPAKRAKTAVEAIAAGAAKAFVAAKALVSAKPTKSAKSAKPAKTSKSAKATKSAAPAAKSGKSAKGAAPAAKSGKSAAPIPKATKSAKPAKNAASAKPAKPSKNAKSVGPAPAKKGKSSK